MAPDDVLFLRRRMNHILITVLLTLLPTATIAIWTGISDHFTIKQKCDKEYVDQTYMSMQLLLVEYQAIWDSFMTQDIKNLERLEDELDKVKAAINELYNYHTGPVRSTNQRDNIFDTGTDSTET